MTPPGARPPGAWCPVCGQGPWVSLAMHLRRKHAGDRTGGPPVTSGADGERARSVCGCRPCGRARRVPR